MENVEDLMKSMKLSEVERKGIRVGEVEVWKAGKDTPQAIGKLFAERQANPADIEQALGRIWCPSRGLECRDLGDNHFLFTFHQVNGKRRTMEDGPWMFRLDMMVVIVYDPFKTVEGMEFNFIPAWVRVSKLPVGMTNRRTTERIGEQVDGLLEVDVDDTAVGAFLRIKIKIDIRKLILRGVTLEVGERERKIWCPFAYEYLPDFCHVCGMLGHIDRDYGDEVARRAGERLYGKHLRFIPSKGRAGKEGSRNNYGSSGIFWSGRSSGGSWRRESGGVDGRRGGVREDRWKRKEDDDEVTSPLKLKPNTQEKKAGKRLEFGNSTKEKEGDVMEEDRRGKNVDTQGKNAHVEP